MKTITKEDLHKLRLSQQKEHYGSQAEEMFINGIFNAGNWNGGDGLIRQYFYDFGYLEQKAAEVESPNGALDFSGDIIVNHQHFNDQNYVTIVLTGWLYLDETDASPKQMEDIAYFTWYKQRGKTENALYNGKPMTEDEYLFVLNALQQTGFTFDLE
jgi:hypothetical protein